MIKTYSQSCFDPFTFYLLNLFPHLLICSFYANSFFLSIIHSSVGSHSKYLMFESYGQKIFIVKSIEQRDVWLQLSDLFLHTNQTCLEVIINLTFKSAFIIIFDQRKRGRSHLSFAKLVFCLLRKHQRK